MSEQGLQRIAMLTLHLEAAERRRTPHLAHLGLPAECPILEHGCPLFRPEPESPGNGRLDKIEDLTQELESQEAAYQAIAEFSTDGYWDWRPVDDVEFYSDRFWEILGYDPAEMPSTPAAWQSVIFDEDKQKALEAFNKHVETKGEHPYHLKVRYRHKDGHTVWVLCRGKVIDWGPAGEPFRMVGTHTDITNLLEEPRPGSPEEGSG